MVRLSAMGDVVRTLPAVSSLRAAYPGAHIGWLVEAPAASAVHGQPWVDEVLVFPRRSLEQKLRALAWVSAWEEFSAFARKLRRRRFELVLDFHSLLRSALLARLSGAPRRVGYARPFGRELSYWFATECARLAPARTSRFERNLALVRYLGVEAACSRTPLVVAPDALARARAALGPGAAPLAIHPGTSRVTSHKRWAPDRYARLARILAEEEGVASIVTWGPAQDDRRAAEAVVAASDGAARLAPETPTVGDLAAVMVSCRVAVANDSGPLHVASLVGTPVVQLLGPTDPIENAPWTGTPSRSVRSAASRGARAMDIAAEAAAEAVRELLVETTPPARRIAGGGE